MPYKFRAARPLDATDRPDASLKTALPKELTRDQLMEAG